MKTTRRTFLYLLGSLPLIGLLAWSNKNAPATLPPTPACDDHDEPTPRQTEGPYFTPNSPERSNLVEPGMRGTKLVLTGQVLNTNCRPLAKALLDWWHCDDDGNYDNQGFTLRGHHYTDKSGNFRLETIVPGVYPGRTRHLHVKVQAPGQPILTTQLYFPDEPKNRRDGIFSPELVMTTQPGENQLHAGFTFVLPA